MEEKLKYRNIFLYCSQKRNKCGNLPVRFLVQLTRHWVLGRGNFEFLRLSNSPLHREIRDIQFARISYKTNFSFL